MFGKTNQKSIVFKIVLFGLMLFITYGLSACQKIPTNAEKVLSAMLTCPNEKLFSLQAANYIGLSVGQAETLPADELKRLQDEISANWQTAVGACMTESAYKAFIQNGMAQNYLSRASLTGCQIAVTGISLGERSESLQTAEVTLSVTGSDGRKQTANASYRLAYDTDGKTIRKLEIVDDAALLGMLK